MARDGERGRGDWKARLGSRNSGPYADASGDTGPVDIAAVRRDDALIDAIASDGPVRTDSAEEYQLAAMLADWRAEIIAPPMTAAPDLDAIVAAVNQEIGARQVRVGAQGGGGRLRLVRPLLGAAAALALVFGGMTAFSYNSEPGDPLWKVKEVVFNQAAQSTVAQRAGTDLDEAAKLINQNPVQAKERLEQARVNADQVDSPQKHDELMLEWKRLVSQLRAMGYNDLADQLDQGTSTKPSDPATSTSAKPKPVPPVDTTVPPVQQTKPADPSDQPTDPTDPPTPTNDKPTLPPTVTTPPPSAEPTVTQPPPTTVAEPTAVQPTSDNGGAPTRVPTQGNPGTTFVVPTGSGGAGTTS
ncbi:anti-sigma-D factor RsdA [Nocardia ninae]|uniref:Anti-sigma-D factor RsdA sigma factor binding region domain-containing protein n=1 Tax=Nocardia ninae NBRC 108245 TaxID=1210091 RepID=A0A511MU39_9NOCA|nr:anti-sigma-D factor RsdA [Nocardia ninae]GEM44105.1 hypothetical protein NN4_86240 [Nocardia ninae NBRC 108245]